MLTAVLFHVLAGFLFGGLGLKVFVLMVYGMGNILVVALAMLTADLSFLGALGHLALAMTGSSVGFLIGAWLTDLLEGDRREVDPQRDDRAPRACGRWTPIE